MLPSSALPSLFSFFYFLFLKFCLLSGFNKDASFNLSVSSLTEPGLYKHNNEVYRHKSVERDYLPKNIKSRSGTFAGTDSQKMDR